MARVRIQTDEDRKKRESKRGIWHNVIKPIVIVFLIVATFRSAVADWNDVPSQSMEPNILVGDRIFVNRLAYDLKVPFTTWHIAEWGGPERGDIIVFYAPNSGTRMVKRVVALPGDVVEMRRNKLYINNELVECQPLDDVAFEAAELADPGPHVYRSEQLGAVEHSIMLQPNRHSRSTIPAMKVPEGHYWVMGDNRDNSGDSRVFGFVPRDRILGKAVGLAFSLDTNDGYTPRWDRFFRGLD